MAGKSTISITFKLDGDSKGFKDLAKDAEGLKTVISSTMSEAKRLSTNTINFAALATGIDAAQRSFNQLHATMKDLGDAYAVQETAEKKLETVMQQRMGSTAEEVQAIKDLASAQQQIGVIGNEVQLSGAQQVATFLTQKESLKTLLPAMNNLIAQQKGLNATTQDAVNVGNLMGKVMQGQTAALTRVGITFDEAEQKVLKYGTEEERAAMLAQVITNNVGQMNSQLAATDSGKQQQLVNVLGDYKEQIGGLVNGALPFVTIAAQAITALSGVATLTAGIKTLCVTLYHSAKAFTVSAAAMIKNKVAALATAAAQKIASAATAAWTGVQKILNLVLSANPIGILITAIGALVTALIAAYKHCDGFREICDKVWSVIKPLANAIVNGLAKAFEWLSKKCKEAWNWLKGILGLGGKKVEVEVDVKKTEEAPTLDLEATKNKYANYKPAKSTATAAVPKAKASEGLIGQLEEKIEDARDRLREATSEAAIEAINKEIEAYEGELDKYQALGKKVAEAVEDGVEDNGPLWKADAETLADISGNIQLLNDQLQNATISEAAEINQQIAAWNAKADAIREAGREAERVSMTTGQALGREWGAVKTVGGSIEGITEALKGNGNAWQMVTRIVDGFINLYNGIKEFIGIIQMMTGATNMQTAAEQNKAAAVLATATADTTATGIEVANSTAKTTASGIEAAADTTAATAKVFKAHSWIPFAGVAIAAAMVATMIAMIAKAKSSVPKFASGGIAYGPTLGLFGEYAGAKNNPEVVAPLDKLRGMLATPVAADFGKVEFEIRGRTLVGILSKENAIINRG
ncbi:MAG: hypothetical protein LKI53_02365 [Bacteroidales bacterium]|jgi:hypothetical protein|nr:hypothetical protein [Bacteroidales bacterium]